MHLKKIFISLIIIAFISTNGFSQQDTTIVPVDTIELSLSEAISKGLERNYQVKIAKKM
jgi:hypothetical protein